MKKYTIKEFAEGKKAVKIENEEQWNKLNKIHKLCGPYSFPRYYTNSESHSQINTDFYRINNWEVLEFSQLDFEDEFVVGWYKNKIVKSLYRNILRNEVIWSSHRFGKDYNVKENFIDWNLLTDLSEIQPFLPSDHADLIKKDTFVLPEYWAIQITPENKAIVNEWKLKQKYNDDLFKYPGYTHVNSDGGGGVSTDFEKENFITFEQFKTHILKESTMEKEVEYYKLVKKEYGSAVVKILGWTGSTTLHVNLYEKNDIQKLKEAGVLDLWFEAVYKEEFKVGDFVELRGGGNGMMSEKRIICQLLEIDEKQSPSGHLQNESHFMFKHGKGFYRTNKSHIVRLANSEEIKAAQIQLPTIDGYQGSYENGIIKYGCAEFSKMFFEHLNSTSSHIGNRTIKSIKLSSDVEISIEEIKQIVEYINKK